MKHVAIIGGAIVETVAAGDYVCTARPTSGAYAGKLIRLDGSRLAPAMRAAVAEYVGEYLAERDNLGQVGCGMIE